MSDTGWGGYTALPADGDETKPLAGTPPTASSNPAPPPVAPLIGAMPPPPAQPPPPSSGPGMRRGAIAAAVIAVLVVAAGLAFAVTRTKDDAADTTLAPSVSTTQVDTTAVPDSAPDSTPDSVADSTPETTPETEPDTTQLEQAADDPNAGLASQDLIDETRTALSSFDATDAEAVCAANATAAAGIGTGDESSAAKDAVAAGVAACLRSDTMARIIVLGTASTDPDLDRQCVAEDLDDLDQADRERFFLQFAAGSPDAETQALLTSILDDCA